MVIGSLVMRAAGQAVYPKCLPPSSVLSSSPWGILRHSQARQKYHVYGEFWVYSRVTSQLGVHRKAPGRILTRCQKHLFYTEDQQLYSLLNASFW